MIFLVGVLVALVAVLAVIAYALLQIADTLRRPLTTAYEPPPGLDPFMAKLPAWPPNPPSTGGATATFTGNTVSSDADEQRRVPGPMIGFE